MVFDRFKRMILGDGRAERPDDSLPPDIPAVPPGMNPWGVPLLDVRPVTLGMVSMTKDPKIASTFLTFQKDDGTGFVDAQPASERETPANLLYKVDGRLVDGVLFQPSVMEHKWAVFCHRGRILLVRSWTRQLQAVAMVQEAGDHVRVHSIKGVLTDVEEPPEFTIRVFDFLMRSHALDEIYPAPLPATTEGDRGSAALWCMSHFGNRAHFATWSHLKSQPPETPLRTDSLLHIAAAQGDPGRVQSLLDGGAPVDVLARDGLAPLHWALASEGTKVLGVLLSRGASVDVRSPEGATPLMNAVQSRDVEKIAFLLDKGGDPNAGDARGFTALHRAAETGNLEAVKLLLAHGASPLVEAHGHTPLSLAAGRSEKAVVRLLKSGK